MFQQNLIGICKVYVDSSEEEEWSPPIDRLGKAGEELEERQAKKGKKRKVPGVKKKAGKGKKGKKGKKKMLKKALKKAKMKEGGESDAAVARPKAGGEEAEGEGEAKGGAKKRKKKMKAGKKAKPGTIQITPSVSSNIIVFPYVGEKTDTVANAIVAASVSEEVQLSVPQAGPAKSMPN